MQTRYNLPETDPEGFNELLKLESFCQKNIWMKSLAHLIKIRASQINKCVYCIHMHANEAIKAGETLQRIVLLPAWQEAPVFTEQERVVLEMTESITLISQSGFSEALYTKAKTFFTDKEIAQIAMAIGLINLWNRVVISSGNRDIS